MNENPLLSRSYTFALQIVKLYKVLAADKKEYVLSKQMLRSGTSVGALIREAQNAESKKDFIHKLAIAQKECDETIYWLHLLRDSGFITEPISTRLEKDATIILKMIKRSIITTKSRMK